MALPLNKVHQQVSQLLKQTDQILINYFSGQKIMKYQLKSQHLEDIVTQADKEIEALFKKTLKQKFPHIGFIGEETSINKIKEYNWIVDPIDGTMNFTYKVPIFGTSIALWKVNQPIYGAISLPLQNQQVHAIKGKGAFLNNKKVKPLNRLSKINFVLFSYGGNDQDRLKIINKLLSIIPLPHSYACTTFQGVAAVLRQADAAVFINNGLWDIAAIVILAQEAGLHCQFVSSWPDIHDPDIRDYRHSLIIGKKTLAKKLIKTIKETL